MQFDQFVLSSNLICTISSCILFLKSTSTCKSTQGGKKTKETAQASSGPSKEPEGAPAGQPARKKRPKETYPTPDRLPSSEYCTSDEDDDGESDGAEDKGVTEPVLLHEELHEELYGLPTPKKPIAHASSNEIAPTELELDSTSSDEESTSGKPKDKQPSPADTTGAHKDKHTHAGVVSLVSWNNISKEWR